MPWEDLDCSTYIKSPETQQLTVIEEWKKWLTTNLDGKLPTIQNLEIVYSQTQLCHLGVFNG